MGANPHFVGRTAELRTLARALHQPDGAAVVTPSVAATGLGGIGKTQLAAAFAHRYGQYFLGGVFWLSLADAASVETEAARCAQWMGDLPPGVTHMSVPEQAQLVRRAWQAPLPRLLIFDNCEDPALLAQWRPTSGGCRVLVTSRRGRWPAGLHVAPVVVGTLERGQSVALLRGLMSGTPTPALPSTGSGSEPLEGEGDESDGAAVVNPSPVSEPVEGTLAGVLDGIAEELGDLPLALHMAGSYLAEMQYDLTPAAYLAQLRRPDLLAHESLQEGEFSPTGHELHVARTFALSMSQLAADDAADDGEPASDPMLATDQTARRLLAAATWLAPGEAMPRMLLRAAVGLDDEEGAGPAVRALDRLVNLGLLEEEAGGSLRLHRLLQRFVVDGLGELVDEMRAALEESVLDAARRVNETGDPRPLLSWQAHLRHITNNVFEQLEERAASLCSETGYHLSVMGDYAGARPYFERAMAIYESVQGDQHPDTALSLNNLGFLLQATGDYTGALPYLHRALAIRQAVLGGQHLDTANSFNNLGVLLNKMRDFAEALPYLQRALAIYESLQGEQHPDTANCLLNLGFLFQVTGDYTGARSYYERALAINESVQGKQHPATASSLNNLGLLLQDTGDYTVAQSYYERALAIKQEVFGEQHPDTALSLNNLGGLLDTMGDYAGARPYFERALAIYEVVLGKQHPDTARSLNNLGILFYYLDDKPQALAYLERALAIREERLGPAHPDTQDTQQSVAVVRAELGDADASVG
ncbi:MAG: tetratricopeptide repeat-containing protein [Caldilineaceae bacterium]